MISYGLPTGHRLVRHPNPHGHETTRRFHVSQYYSVVNYDSRNTSHPEKEKETKERESDRERQSKRKIERNNALLLDTCIFNLIFEIIHI